MHTNLFFGDVLNRSLFSQIRSQINCYTHVTCIIVLLLLSWSNQCKCYHTWYTTFVELLLSALECPLQLKLHYILMSVCTLGSVW